MQRSAQSKENMNNQKIRLWQAEMVRIFLTGLVLLIPKIPFSIKIILIMFFDRLDCSAYFYPKKGPLFSDQKEICFTTYYSFADKIGDILSYTLLWLYYLYYVESQYILKVYITFWFFIRVIGTILFTNSQNKKWIILFPNVFLESLLIIAILQDLNFAYDQYQYLYWILLFGVILYKLIQEILLHQKIEKILN